MKIEENLSRVVLVVDDCGEVRDTIQDFLENQGFTVETASSGEEALDLARVRNFDVVLVDICMPGMSGETLLARIKELYPKVPVIIFTGVDDEEIAKNCMKKGAYDYLRKPFDYDYLKTSILSSVICH